MASIIVERFSIFFDVNPRLPAWTLLGLLTLPLTIRGIKGAFNSDDTAKLMPGMAANVITVQLTQLLMGIGFILARVI